MPALFELEGETQTQICIFQDDFAACGGGLHPRPQGSHSCEASICCASHPKPQTEAFRCLAMT